MSGLGQEQTQLLLSDSADFMLSRNEHHLHGVIVGASDLDSSVLVLSGVKAKKIALSAASTLTLSGKRWGDYREQSSVSRR